MIVEGLLKSGQAANVHSAAIVGLTACVPPRIVGNDYFVGQFGEGVADVTKMTGVRTRHWVDEKTTTADLCVAAGEKLLVDLGWEPGSVDALIFISQTPDYRLPATAAVMQPRLNLRPGIIAFDVNLGCSAYPYGLWLAMSIVQTGAARRVLLAVGDTSSRVVDPTDRATAMLFGDAGTVTAIEYDENAAPAHFVLGTDGRGANNLIIPCGASRQKTHDKTPNDQTKLFMDGGEIFTFTLKAVPTLVSETMQIADRSAEDYDYFLFHQANTFMINHLAKKAKLPSEKVPINIDAFGNTSSATIPLLMCDKLKEALSVRTVRVGMFGFGVGYSWGGASIDVGALKSVDLITL
ncbi:3-oxoacyl-[acyl-carrier-protein] synthase III C-terminal domain-containing protein [Sphingobium boeckii]|uniref:3-oxoacyl-[acyl-carrier-protein] synthase-3 n=1 Tax=Sphingobium boeckii TaxID=1082345 RepID=A0A7W9AHM1_9SPHN|nr:3-oxoacyl-[acyl-carrier-protein] synthase-3 [Sphingobium boeckii]